MKHLSRKITIILMVLGIIFVAGCNKEDNVKTEDVNGNLGREGDCTVWEGGKSCTFKYEDVDYEVYLCSRIALGSEIAEFKLEGLPEGTINRKGKNDSYRSRLTFEEETQYVPYRGSGRTMEIDLNSSIVSNPSDKTKALFEQNMNCITLNLRYSGDSIF